MRKLKQEKNKSLPSKIKKLNKKGAPKRKNFRIETELTGNHHSTLPKYSKSYI
jgi:hypothetical protein